MEKATKKTEKKTEVAKTDSKTLVKKAKPQADKKKDVAEVKASLRYLRMSAKKIRLVTNPLRGQEIPSALAGLNFVNKAAARPIIKLLNSAVANAENNFHLDKNDLYVKVITANAGPVLKRWMPRAHGRSAPIHKRTSHIDLILGVRAGAKKQAVIKKESKEDIKIVSPDQIKKTANKSINNKGQKTGGKESKGFLKGVFQRKTG